LPLGSLEQLLAQLNAIVQRLTAIDERQAGQSQQHQQLQEFSYFDFLATQPPKFTETTDPLESNHWLCVTEQNFKLLHRSEFQKTLFAAQQLRGSASSWWATYIVVIQDNHQVSWNEFFTAFHAFQLESCVASCGNSWIYSKGPIVCMSTSKSSTI
jgi:hypothetical protein